MLSHNFFFSNSATAKSSTFSSTISTDVNRQIFDRMVTEMMRDPAETLLVIATWLWLTQLGFPNIIPKISGVSDVIIGVLADEAVLLLRSLHDATVSRVNPTRGLSLTSRILQRPLSLHALCRHPARVVAASGIRRVVRELVAPRVSGDVPEDLRTLFLTFSRGLSVSREEVTGVFAGCYGDCVERVEMGTRVDQHCLYARLILKSPIAVERIMNGRRVTKLRVHGKHIWARRYEIRD